MIKVEIKGLDKLTKDLKDLGVNRIPSYAARAITEIANRVQDAMITDAQSNLMIRGNWLIKGSKFGINRKAANRNDLTATVSTRAPWLIEQEMDRILTPKVASSLAVPGIWRRGERLAATRSPRNLKNTFKLKTRFGNEAIYQRIGTGRLSSLVARFILRKKTPEPQRIHLISAAWVTIDKVSVQVMNEMIEQAINEKG